MTSCICGNGDCVLCEAVLQLDLSNRAMCEIQGLISKENYKTGEILFRENDPGDYLVILKTGCVKLVTLLYDGREQIIGLGLPWHLLGFNQLSMQCYSYSAIATGPVSACKIRHRDVLKVLEQHPATAIRIIDVLSKEMTHTRNLMRVMGHKTVTEKLASFILSLIPRNKPDLRVLDMPLTRLEIAEILALREETVCRAMAELKRMEIINAPRGRIIILDMEKLLSLTKGGNRGIGTEMLREEPARVRPRLPA